MEVTKMYKREMVSPFAFTYEAVEMIDITKEE